MGMLSDETLVIAATLDITSDACPITFVKTKLKLDEMKAGEVLAVILSDGAPRYNVPRSVRADGHEVLAVEPWGEYYRLLIRKRAK